MSQNFITNTGQKSLKTRLNTLISISSELKFLVGFFYFSGWEELYKSLQENENLTLKILVGLQVDQIISKGYTFEHGYQDDHLSDDDRFGNFMKSLSLALNNDDKDNENFYNQVHFFVEMIECGRLIIRKTKNPNHAKLYIFKLNDAQALIQGGDGGQFITGSSNLTSAGLSGQEEFNVEIKDYGYLEADKYFEMLWEDSAPITETPYKKEQLIEFIGHKTMAAKVTPFEAYALILKTYIDLQQQKHIKSSVLELISKNGFKEYRYQTDAVNQGLSIINEYNGVVIADVVGLGKSVIASLIAKNLDRKTLVICPPGLIGERNVQNPTGWYEYIYNFEINGEVESRGKLIDIAESIDKRNVEVVIIDEAHYYRNQDTEDYEALLKICRDRIVILLTATPFNNSPADIFSLLKLFIIPGKSGITIDQDLEGLFVRYGNKFKRLSNIIKFHNSKKARKNKKAKDLYREMFGEGEVNINIVRQETKSLANQIKHVISPVIIRRNRLDLKNDYVYSREVTELSEVIPPKELFYTLSPAQSKFYDKVLTKYFGEDGEFSGAIYQPFSYVKRVEDENSLDEAGNRAFIQQANLYDFMRRLLVKRFESSFGAFYESISRFLNIHKRVFSFIEKTSGKYILDRKLMDSLMDEESLDDVFNILDGYQKNILNKKVPKDNSVYDVNEFELKEEFLSSIIKDIELFETIQKDLESLDIVENDPKLKSVCDEIDLVRKKNPNMKVIVFSEYVDSVNHLESYFKSRFKDRVLICDGNISSNLHKTLNSNFNAQYKGAKEDDFDILVTSDKLSEGFNLNRAGVIINYDIPWNPTRVIQRVGRINRIGAKVFEKLYIYNFFPSEAGSDYIQIREIATQKMFLIHNALGEDSRIFEEDEEPTPAGLFNKINDNPEEEGEENISTNIRNRYHDIEINHPEVIKKISSLPGRVKTGKDFKENQVCVLRRKGLSLFTHISQQILDGKNEIIEVTFDEFLQLVTCEFDTKHRNLSSQFWAQYEGIKNIKSKPTGTARPKSLEAGAIENLKCSLKLISPTEERLINFIKVIIDDIRNYRTLSERTLGRLSRNKISLKSNEQEIKNFISEVFWIMNSLGENYLERIKERIENQREEVVIAVENIITLH